MLVGHVAPSTSNRNINQFQHSTAAVLLLQRGDVCVQLGKPNVAAHALQALLLLLAN